MRHTICQAIRSRCLLRFLYDGYERVVEPHCCGCTSKGNLILSAYQVEGLSRTGLVPDWRVFTVSRMRTLTLLPAEFAGPRQGYNPRDPRFDVVYCQL